MKFPTAIPLGALLFGVMASTAQPQSSGCRSGRPQMSAVSAVEASPKESGRSARTVTASTNPIFDPRVRIAELPAGSHDGLAVAIAQAGPGGAVLVRNGLHSESKTVTVTIPVHIMGESGAIIESSVFSDYDGTWPINIHAAIHVKGVRGAAVQGLWLRPPASATKSGSAAVVLEDSPKSRVLNNRVSGFQFGVVVQQSDQALVSGNSIAVNSDPALIEADGVIVLNGQFAQVTENTITGATFAGIWANDLNGVAAQNTLTGNFLGLLACHDSSPAYLISGNPAGSLQPAARWLAHANAAHGNWWGLLVADGAHDNLLTNNDSSGNSTYDIELSSATSRFGSLLPTSYDNLVVQAFRSSGERAVVKNCGVNNIVIGDVTLVDLKKDPCY